jgi:O-antigen/teichoic acid export membrane protein
MYKAQKATTIGFLISLPIISLFAPFIVKITCGVAYEAVILTFRLLLLAVFFVGANAFKIQFLLVCGKADIYSKIHVAAAWVGFPLIFILIHVFSYLGAAIATVIIEVAIFILTLRILKEVRNSLAQSPAF